MKTKNQIKMEVDICSLFKKRKEGDDVFSFLKEKGFLLKNTKPQKKNDLKILQTWKDGFVLFEEVSVDLFEEVSVGSEIIYYYLYFSKTNHFF